MFILTSLTLPLAFLTAFSRMGVSWRQGPHHSAQKSISTGWRFDSSMTSFTKVWVVVSLMRSGAACGAPPPCSTMVTMSSPKVFRKWAPSSTPGAESAWGRLALIGGVIGYFQLPGTGRRLDFGVFGDHFAINCLMECGF